ncbi:MAG TPA: MMPL family transporter [Candidatus Dormibacteraeota bacterium]|nr:MMPL family transporter [Candidatus Dormibacteraeota bacterium]
MRNGRRDWLAGVGRLAVRVRWAIVATAVALAGAGAVYSIDVPDHLVDGGYYPPSAESAQVDRILSSDFKAGTPDLVLVARTDGSVDDPAVVAAGQQLTERLQRSAGVVYAQSYWTTGLPSLRGDDGRTAIVAALLSGSENDALNRAKKLVPSVTGDIGPLHVRATGLAEVDREIQQQSEDDLRKAEILATPAVAIILLLVFGSVVSASLVLVVGALSVVGTLAALKLLASFTSVSIFSMNLTTALSFGLAVDYSLFVVTRYREELDRGRSVSEAVSVAMGTAGRTVLFSALTVALAVSALIVFPLYFLSSLGYAAVAVIVLSAVSALLVLPAILGILGPRVNSLNLLRPLGVTGRTYEESRLWRWLARRVMRRPIVVGGVVAAFLLVLAYPFAHAQFGVNDERVLPLGSQAHLAGDEIRTHFAIGEIQPVEVVLQGASAASEAQAIDDYAKRLSALGHVQRVDAATGSYENGQQVSGPLPTSARFAAAAGTWLSVVPDTAPDSAAGERLERDVRSLAAPFPKLVGGLAGTQVDSKAAVSDRVPVAALVILLSMSTLLFLFSGSLLVPIKAMLLSLLSLTATFGAMVFIFQDGHLRWLVGDFTATGQLEMTIPVLVFCLAFGLSMDYEVFLVARIREEYHASGDNTRAVVSGLARTGRLFSAAALAVASVMIVLATSGNVLVKLTGTGIAIAILMDASLVRGVLVPSFMRLAGRANWWAPGPLRWFQARFGIQEAV